MTAGSVRPYANLFDDEVLPKKSDATPKESKERKRAKMEIESLEPRILLSATFFECETQPKANDDWEYPVKDYRSTNQLLDVLTHELSDYHLFGTDVASNDKQQSPPLSDAIQAMATAPIVREVIEKSGTQQSDRRRNES